MPPPTPTLTNPNPNPNPNLCGLPANLPIYYPSLLLYPFATKMQQIINEDIFQKADENLNDLLQF